MEGYSVLIVGGGLAGLSAAMHLKRLGIGDVAVVERMSGDLYGRYHRICGEAVSERFLKLSGADRGCIVRSIDSIKVSCGSTDIRFQVKGHIIDREALLESTRDECGAIMVNASVTGVEPAEGGFLVHSTAGDIGCRYLIGADGAFSVVRKDIIGTSPEVKLAAANHLVERDSETSELGFKISPVHPGMYSWDFPSKDGRRSIGSTYRTEDPPHSVEKGTRFIVCGSDRTVVEGNCCIVGDAAMLANPISYGGIGAALLSGRKAAEAIAKDDLSSYQRWVRRDVMFDRRFMESFNRIKGWDAKDVEQAVAPFRKGFSYPRALYAMMRHPMLASVYTSIWMGFRRGW